MSNEKRLAQGLGWFSIGLGLAQVIAPRAFARFIGVQNHRVLPGLGMREIASGVAILTQENPVGAVWSRVGGDAMDLSLLGKELTSETAQRNRLLAATAAVTAVTVLDVLCAGQLSRDGASRDQSPEEKKMAEAQERDIFAAVTIDRPPLELYNFWRHFENLPRFMTNLKSVTVTGEGRSHWVAKGPGDKTVEWDAEVTEDQPGERIAWRSVEGSDVETSGVVRFTPATGGRGTYVTVEMDYNPPGGILGKAAAALSHKNPNREVYDALRAFKQLMEVGEIVLSDGVVREDGIRQKPGQPSPTQAAA